MDEDVRGDEGTAARSARAAQGTSGGERAPAPHVLELRIHGISNTPPAAMLEVAATDVEMVRGDSLGSFWTLTPDALAYAGSVPPTHHDHVPAGVRREAYSWGQMARTSPAAPGARENPWVQRLSRAGWMLLVPLGLANAAYWSRRLSPEPERFGRGAGGVRVFGLGLTVLLVMASCAVALDLVATQCVVGGAVVCPQLPEVLRGLAALPWTQRLAVMSVVPVAVLGVLWWLSAGSRVRYELVTSGGVEPPTAPGATGEQRWSLARPGFWTRWALTGGMARLHVAAGLCVVVLLTAAALAWGDPTRPCAALPTFVGAVEECTTGAGAGRPAVALFAVTALVLAGVVLAVFRAQYVRLPSTGTGTGGGLGSATTWLVGAAVVLYVADLALLVAAGPTRVPPSLVGLSFFPLSVLALMLLVVLVAATWRAAAWRTWTSSALGVGIAVVLLLSAADLGGVDRPLGRVTPTTVLCGLGIVLMLLVAVPGSRARRPGAPPGPRSEGWGGWGPAVWLVLSLGTVVALTSVVTVVVGDWLNGPAPAVCLDGHQVARSGCGAGGPAGLRLPPVYPMFAVTVPGAVGLTAVVVAVGGLVHLRRRDRRAELPSAGEPPRTVPSTARSLRTTAGSVDDLRTRPELTGARERARRVAALAQRAELYLFALALGLGVALCSVLWFSARPDPERGALAVPERLVPLATTVGIWTTVVLWAALLLRVVTKASGDRPVGLLWDLMCFLPRSAHPLGPPCYAERVVPEIAGRIDDWFHDEQVPAPERERRRVVLSAHSLGAVLAVAVLFARDRKDGASRIGLLTYGTQLRPYFGRFFPELLGAQALGTEPCPRPRVRRTAPWVGDETASAPPPPALAADTLVARLAGGDESRAPAPWVSLWRATDPLGMPARSFVPNSVDRAAEEIDATAFVARVGTHGGYPRVDAYRRAFDEVLGRLEVVTRARRTPSAGGSP